MVSANLGPESRGGQPADLADVLEGRRAWAEMVRDAMHAKRISLRGLEDLTGIRKQTLSTWLLGKSDPDPRAITKIADALMQPADLMFARLGWLPTQMAQSLSALRVAWELDLTVNRLSELLQEATPFDNAARIASALRAQTREWRIIEWPTVRGGRYPMPRGSFLRFERLQGGTGDVEEDRRELNGMLSSTIATTAALWCDETNPQLQEVRWPALILEVATTRVSRAPRQDYNANVPPSILVWGDPDTGAASVASMLASCLRWGFTRTLYAAFEQFGRNAATDQFDYDAMEFEIAQRLLERPNVAGRHLVWILDSPTVMDRVAPQLADMRLPLVIYLRMSDEFISYSAKLTAEKRRLLDAEVRDEDVRREMWNSQALVVQQLLQRPTDTYHIVDVHPDDLTGQRIVDDDDLFDVSVEATAQALAWLHERHGGPAVSDSTHDPQLRQALEQATRARFSTP
ncbi:MAG: helix-turn-helix domain-containing protein [Egibacteraceae bacterium]